MRNKTIFLFVSIPLLLIFLVCWGLGAWLWHGFQQHQRETIQYVVRDLQIPTDCPYQLVQWHEDSARDVSIRAIFQVDPGQISQIREKFQSKLKYTPKNLPLWVKDNHWKPREWNPEADPGCDTIYCRFNRNEWPNTWVCFSEKTGRIYYCQMDL